MTIPLEIADRTQSTEDKAVRLFRTDEYNYTNDPGLVVYLAAGSTVVVQLKPGGTYAITATAGHDWYGSNEQFGDQGTTVELGSVTISQDRPNSLVLGAPERIPKVVPYRDFWKELPSGGIRVAGSNKT